MRRLPAVSVLSLVLVLPALGQHMGGYQGVFARPSFSAHAGPSQPGGRPFNGGFRPARSHGFPTTPWYPWNGVVNPPVAPRAPFASGPGRAPYQTNRSGYPGHREPYRHDHDRDRDRRFAFFNGLPLLTPTWFGPGLWGYPDSGYDADSDLSQDAAYPAYGPPYADQQPYGPGPSYDGPPAEPERAPRPAYSSNGAPPPPAMEPARDEERPALTLVFWDLRPDQHIHDYLIARNTLVVLDGGHRREIPMVDIDVTATQQANRDAGVEFAVPTTSK